MKRTLICIILVSEELILNRTGDEDPLIFNEGKAIVSLAMLLLIISLLIN